MMALFVVWFAIMCVFWGAGFSRTVTCMWFPFMAPFMLYDWWSKKRRGYPTDALN